MAQLRLSGGIQHQDAVGQHRTTRTYSREKQLLVNGEAGEVPCNMSLRQSTNKQGCSSKTLMNLFFLVLRVEISFLIQAMLHLVLVHLVLLNLFLWLVLLN